MHARQQRANPTGDREHFGGLEHFARLPGFERFALGRMHILFHHVHGGHIADHASHGELLCRTDLGSGGGHHRHTGCGQRRRAGEQIRQLSPASVPHRVGGVSNEHRGVGGKRRGHRCRTDPGHRGRHVDQAPRKLG